MLCKGLVWLLVPAHLLALTATDHTGSDIVAVVSVNGEELLTETDVLEVDRIEVTLAEREVVYGVKQIGLTGTVVANEAVDIAAEGDVGLGVVLEVG